MSDSSETSLSFFRQGRQARQAGGHGLRHVNGQARGQECRPLAAREASGPAGRQADRQASGQAGIAKRAIMAGKRANRHTWSKGPYK